MSGIRWPTFCPMVPNLPLTRERLLAFQVAAPVFAMLPGSRQANSACWLTRSLKRHG